MHRAAFLKELVQCVSDHDYDKDALEEELRRYSFCEIDMIDWFKVSHENRCLPLRNYNWTLVYDHGDWAAFDTIAGKTNLGEDKYFGEDANNAGFPVGGRRDDTLRGQPQFGYYLYDPQQAVHAAQHGIE